MDNIALAIFSVGLCFYVVYREVVTGENEYVASFFAFVSALILIIKTLIN